MTAAKLSDNLTETITITLTADDQGAMDFLRDSHMDLSDDEIIRVAIGIFCHLQSVEQRVRFENEV